MRVNHSGPEVDNSSIWRKDGVFRSDSGLKGWEDFCY